MLELTSEKYSRSNEICFPYKSGDQGAGNILKISIVIVNYRTAEMTIQCVKSVLDSCSDEWFEIIIIDNCSNDSSVEMISRYVSDCLHGYQISLISSEYNGGYSAGNNDGIRRSSADYILLLNSDSIISGNAVQRLAWCLDENPRLGIASPGLYSPDGAQQNGCFRYPRPISELVKAAATGPITRLLPAYDTNVPLANERTYPEWTSFACVMVRRKVFEDIGFLDDGFFMYFEDIDFCRRVRAAGWGIINEPKAKTYHIGGGSSNVTTSIASRRRVPKYYYESRTRYYYKYYGYVGLISANIMWSCGFLIAIFRKFLNKNYKSSICEKQWIDIWVNFTNPTKPYTHPDMYGVTNASSK